MKDYFKSHNIGDVISAKIVRDHKTRVSKGIGYVEFADVESVAKALKLSGNQIMGSSIVVQRTEQEKQLLMHQIANGNFGQVAAPQREQPSRKLFINNIASAITDSNLQTIFAEFGEIESLELQKDSAGASKGLAFLTFVRPVDARRACDTMNRFDLAGKILQISYIAEKNMNQRLMSLNNEGGDDDEVQHVSRADLMSRLSRANDANAPSMSVSEDSSPTATANPPTPFGTLLPTMSSTPARNCRLTNMFDPAEETEPNWDEEIKEDVLSECSKFGRIDFLNVDKENPNGHVYIRFDSIESCRKCIDALNGRWFAKKQISANFMDDLEFERVFGAMP